MTFMTHRVISRLASYRVAKGSFDHRLGGYLHDRAAIQAARVADFENVA